MGVNRALRQLLLQSVAILACFVSVVHTGRRVARDASVERWPAASPVAPYDWLEPHVRGAAALGRVVFDAPSDASLIRRTDLVQLAVAPLPLQVDGPRDLSVVLLRPTGNTASIRDRLGSSSSSGDSCAGWGAR